MIHSISGRVIEARAQSVIVSPGGSSAFELEVMVPAYWAATAAESRGRVVRLHTKLHIESINQGAAFSPRLIGFPTPEDRAFFELFTSVKGLGVRKALKAMAIEPGAIVAAISSRDARSLQKLPEIGKRLAETIIAELHGKLGSFAASAAGFVEPAVSPRGPAEEAVSALMALGQTRTEAEQSVTRALRGADDPDAWSADEIVTRAFAGG
ncbi:MAG: hypothetical protein H6810_12865 [Phycisphaeraceae bacterium]|nr:MAG: hypothetical protein H6810_12865 [Phycisphaeraceae bacterium]